MRIGLFFGSFNPIHVGHMVIANYMAAYTDLDNIWFVVSPHNPHKEKSSLLNSYHRLELVHLAIDDHPQFRPCDIEFNLPQPSYTIDTLTHLNEKYPQHDFALIMGTDNLTTFHKWKNYEQILEHYEIYVYPRLHLDGGALKDHPKVTMTDAPIIEISASFIRRSIKEKKDVRFYLPYKTHEFLNEMHFYEKDK